MKQNKKKKVVYCQGYVVAAVLTVEQKDPQSPEHLFGKRRVGKHHVGLYKSSRPAECNPLVNELVLFPTTKLPIVYT